MIKTKSYIGFAINAGKIVYGADNILLKRKPGVVLYDITLAENSRTKLTNFLDGRQIPYFSTDLTIYLNKQNCKAIAITEKHLAEAIIKQFKES